MSKIVISLLFILAVCKSVNAQTNYSTQTFESLQKLKAEAVKANDLAKAADVKKEIEAREAEKKKIADLQIELDKKVKAEDFTAAATAKEELKVLKDNKAKKEELRQQIATAVTGSDFDKAAKLKSELGALTLQNDRKALSPEDNSKGKNQAKPFEGKVVGAVTYVPEAKSPFLPYQTITCYKLNKRRLEYTMVNGDISTTTIMIADANKNEALTMIEVKSVRKKKTVQRTATIKNIVADPSTRESIVYMGEPKTLFGYTCKPAVYSYQSPKLTYQLNCYANKDFWVLGYDGQKNEYLILDYSVPGQVDSKVTAITEEPLSDELFSTIPPPEYILKDERSKDPVISQHPAKISSTNSAFAVAPEVKYELGSSGDLSVNGVKLFNIKETKKANKFFGIPAEITVTDNSGQMRLKCKPYPKSNILFLDDNKSYIPFVYFKIEELAKFIVNDSLFTTNGYNLSYKCDYIKKYRGSCYDPNAKPGQNYINFEMVGEDVFSYGKKVFSVKKTRMGNPITTEMPEFTVYDVNGKGWMYFERLAGKMMFMDDGKSFLSRQCDASTSSVAEFIAQDTLFTERGFNIAYREAYIKKHNGYDESAKSAVTKSAGSPVEAKYINDYVSEINRDGKLVAVYKTFKTGNGDNDDTYITVTANKKQVAIITLNSKSSYHYSKIFIKTTSDGKEARIDRSDDYNKSLNDAFNWLSENNYFNP